MFVLAAQQPDGRSYDGCSVNCSAGGKAGSAPQVSSRPRSIPLLDCRPASGTDTQSRTLHHRDGGTHATRLLPPPPPPPLAPMPRRPPGPPLLLCPRRCPLLHPTPQDMSELMRHVPLMDIRQVGGTGHMYCSCYEIQTRAPPGAIAGHARAALRSPRTSWCWLTRDHAARRRPCLYIHGLGAACPRAARSTPARGPLRSLPTACQARYAAHRLVACGPRLASPLPQPRPLILSLPSAWPLTLILLLLSSPSLFLASAAASASDPVPARHPQQPQPLQHHVLPGALQDLCAEG